MRKVMLIIAIIGVAGCNSAPPPPSTQTGTAERAAHDSMLAKSKLPGAAAVGRAQGVDSLARARVEALDTIH